jgi:hypothetical protein
MRMTRRKNMNGGEGTRMVIEGREVEYEDTEAFSKLVG